MTKALVLTAITGSQAGKRITLSARTSTIGSASNNDVVLHDRLVGPFLDSPALEKIFTLLVTGEINHAIPLLPHLFGNGEEHRITEAARPC